jgi:hypothetical protein
MGNSLRSSCVLSCRAVIQKNVFYITRREYILLSPRAHLNNNCKPWRVPAADAQTVAFGRRALQCRDVGIFHQAACKKVMGKEISIAQEDESAGKEMEIGNVNFFRLAQADFSSGGFTSTNSV